MNMSLYINRIKKIVFIFFALAIFLCSSSYAAEIIQLDQAKIKLGVVPGQSTTGTIRVTNPSNKPWHIRIYLQDWVYLPAGDGSKEFRTAGTTELSGAGWITFIPAEFVIPAYGVEEVHYMVRVPEDAKGGHYAILFFEGLLTEPKDMEQGVNVAVAVRVGSLFYIEAKGTVDRRARLKNLEVTRESNDMPLKIKADFMNMGNVDITTNGGFYIIDEEGMVYGRGKFNDAYTFPNDTARLHADCKEAIPAGIYDLVITLEIGEGETLVKEVTMTAGQDGRILSFETADNL